VNADNESNPDPKKGRKARLAAELRANLKRRKVKARTSGAPKKEADAPDAGKDR